MSDDICHDMARQNISLSLSPEAMDILDRLRKAEDRSASSMIDVLLKRASRRRPAAETSTERQPEGRAQ